MNVSQRIIAVQSPIIPTVADLIRANPGTISLGLGMVYYGPPREALERVIGFDQHKYGPVYGTLELLDTIASKLRSENGIDVSKELRVVVTAGGNMAFVNALLAIADPGDEIILNGPYYFNHEMAVRMANCRPVIVPTDELYQLQPALISEAITPRTRAVVTISPNNPTGAVYPEADLREVNELCRARRIYHINDEAYEYFTYGGARHFSPGSLGGEHTISLFSLSKAYGFASWRIGYMTIAESLFESIKKIQDTILICPSLISQVAAVGAMNAGRAYCMDHIRALSEMRESVREALESVGDFCVVPPTDGTFYYLIKLDTDMRPLCLVERLVREYGVAAIPGNAFGMEGCSLRVSYGALNKETADEGMHRLVQGVRRILRRPGRFRHGIRCQPNLALPNGKTR